MISHFLPPAVASVAFLQLVTHVMTETFPSNIWSTWMMIILQGSMKDGIEYKTQDMTKTNFCLYIWSRIWEESWKNCISHYILSGQTEPTNGTARQGCRTEQNRKVNGFDPFILMHIGLTDRPSVPHNLMSNSWEPCSFTEVPDCTQTKTSNILWVQEKDIQQTRVYTHQIWNFKN